MDPHPPSSPAQAADGIQPIINARSLGQPHEPPKALAQDGPTAASQNNATSLVSPVPVHAASAVPPSVPELHLQEPSPIVASRPVGEGILQSPSQRSSAASSPRPPKNRVFAEIPSAYDLYSGGSPKSRISSPDTGSSSGRSSANESKHRFEKLPNGGHRHNLSAPKRHQFLANQVRRFKDFLEGKREKDKDKGHDHDQGHGNGNGNGDKHGHGHHHHPASRELVEHPLSLIAEKVEDFEADHFACNSKKHNVKDDFVQKYGDLQHVVGRGE